MNPIQILIKQIQRTNNYISSFFKSLVWTFAPENGKSNPTLNRKTHHGKAWQSPSVTIHLSLSPSLYLSASVCLWIDWGQAFWLLDWKSFEFIKRHILEMRMWHWTKEKSVFVSVWMGTGLSQTPWDPTQIFPGHFAVLWKVLRKNARQ